MEKKHRVDGRLPHDLEERLINWKSELEYLKETNPPRYYGGDIDETKTKLHILADAFIQGYGSVSYIRKVNKDTCNIVFTIRKSCLAHLRFIIKLVRELKLSVMKTAYSQSRVVQFTCVTSIHVQLHLF